MTLIISIALSQRNEMFSWNLETEARPITLENPSSNLSVMEYINAMDSKTQLLNIYNSHIIKAELSVLVAYESADTKPSDSDDELIMAIHHLHTAKIQLENLRAQQL